MLRQNFVFNLPPHLIAQKPAPAKKTRLLVLSLDKDKIVHSYFQNLPDYIRKGDLFVFNDSAVIPSRIWGISDKAGQVEVSLINRVIADRWEIIVRPPIGSGLKTKIYSKNRELVFKLIKKTGYGGWEADLIYNKGRKLEDVLNRLAQINTPFYIKRNITKISEYQNIYAKKNGSMQCPTAGLHFTNSIMQRIMDKGAATAFITLHIGGSILPLGNNRLNSVRVYREYYEISSETKSKVNQAKKSGGRIIAVGTTTMRALESSAASNGGLKAEKAWTDLTIKPGYKFKIADGFLTNFHLPGSSHLLLTAALTGSARILSAYKEALKKGYRFLDFGDSMLVLPA